MPDSKTDSPVAEPNAEQKNTELEEASTKEGDQTQVDLTVDADAQRQKTLLGIENSALSKAEDGEMTQEYFDKLPPDVKQKVEGKYPDLFKEPVVEEKQPTISQEDIDKMVEEKLQQSRDKEEFEKLKARLPEQVSPEQKEAFDTRFQELRSKLGDAQALKYAAMDARIELKNDDPVRLGMDLANMSNISPFTERPKRDKKEDEMKQHYKDSLPAHYRKKLKS